MSGSKINVHIIIGPTASGKSAHALKKAATCNGVIINADSLQIYDALPLLTAQPSAADKAQMPHRLYGTMAAQDICTAALWRDLAIQEIRLAQAQGQTPLVVGGTGFYIKALTEGFSPIPDVPAQIRADSNALQEKLGNPAFHAALAEIDPVMAARLHPNDTQRLVRAWEVITATGQSLSEWQALPPAGPPADLSFTIEVIMPERDVLYERCNARFDQMMDQGALDEVKAFDDLIKAGTVPADSAVTHALGFQALQSYLAGALSLEDAIIQAKADTRHYAKRQTTWCRNQIKII